MNDIQNRYWLNNILTVQGYFIPSEVDGSVPVEHLLRYLHDADLRGERQECTMIWRSKLAIWAIAQECTNAWMLVDTQNSVTWFKCDQKEKGYKEETPRFSLSYASCFIKMRHNLLKMINFKLVSIKYFLCHVGRLDYAITHKHCFSLYGYSGDSGIFSSTPLVAKDTSCYKIQQL